MSKALTILATLNLTKNQVMNMEFEEFCDVAEQCGWSTGSPELMRETIELMFS